MARIITALAFVLACAPVIRAQTVEREPVDASTATASSQPAAAQAAQSPERKQPSTYDKIWTFAEWYEDPSNPVVQKVLFSGRYQHEYAVLDADQGDLDEWNVRRMRVGPRITLFRTFTLHAEVELNPQEGDPLYQRFTDFYLQWSRSGRFVVTAGKHGVLFTMDGSTSSKDLLAIDRSNLTNNIWFPQEYMPGVSVSGEDRAVDVSCGCLLVRRSESGIRRASTAAALRSASSAMTSRSRSTPRKRCWLATTSISIRIYNNTFTRQLEHIVSVNFKFERDRWGVRTDLSAATGYLGQSDMWGVMAMPFVNVTNKLQFLGRYTFLDSADPNGVRLGTYESRLVPGRGDRYNELYLGANYFFYGHKLKLQTGVQHADMDDRAADGGAYSGVSWITGLRVGW